MIQSVHTLKRTRHTLVHCVKQGDEHEPDKNIGCTPPIRQAQKYDAVNNVRVKLFRSKALLLPHLCRTAQGNLLWA